MNKRGQFYLIAAIALVSVVISFVIISNYASNRENLNVQNLQEEISIESSKTLDYAIYNNFSSTQINDLLTNFSESYIKYQNRTNNDLYFIFGDKTQIKVVAYQNSQIDAFIDVGSGFTKLKITPNQIYSNTFPPLLPYNTLKFKINNQIYNLGLLNNTENFHFIISNNKRGQDYIATG